MREPGRITFLSLITQLFAQLEFYFSRVATWKVFFFIWVLWQQMLQPMGPEF